MNTIEQLKNPFVFGWVSEELQAKAREHLCLGLAQSSYSYGLWWR